VRLGIEPEGRSADGRYRYQGVPCPGLCDGTPALFLDGRFYAGRDVSLSWPPQDKPTPQAHPVPGDVAVTGFIGSDWAFAWSRGPASCAA